MGKVKLGAIPYVYPVPIVLVGAEVNGKPNYATIGDCAIMGITPPLVAISLGESHYTTKGVLENCTFSINLPSTEHLALVDYFGQVSGHDVDKSKYVQSFYGELTTAPMIGECPVNLECRVLDESAIQHRRIFIAEVAQAYVDERCVSEDDGKKRIADLAKLDPIL